MENPDTDLWDVVAPSNPEHSVQCKQGLDTLKDTLPAHYLRQSEISNCSSGISSTSSSLGGSPAIAQDQLAAEDALPALSIPEAYFDTLPEENNKEDQLAQVANASQSNKARKAAKKPKEKKRDSKLKTSEEDEVRESLPPCNVCGAKSSGFHFGVITCESCKVFFRRSLAKEKSFFCHRKENCEINQGNRSDCQFCRLKKCNQVGMSKNGIRKGRYSFKRKIGYKNLVKKHESEEQLKLDEEKRQKEEHLSQIKATIERLKNLHDRHRLVTPEVLENVRMAQQKKKEYLKGLEEAMGPTPPISPDDAAEFFKTTGIDITGYIESIKNCSENCLQRFCGAVIEYLKEMDEYMSLSLQDRITVLKGGFHDWVWISQNEIFVNSDSMMTCIFCGMCFAPEQFGLLMTREDVVQFLRPTVILKELQLTDSEIAIITAFVFFDTSKCTELEEPEKVNQIQNHLLDCLLHVLEENRGASKAMNSFGRIIHAFSEMRKGKEFNDKLLVKIADMFAGQIKFSNIIAEVYDIPDSLVGQFSSLQLLDDTDGAGVL